MSTKHTQRIISNIFEGFDSFKNEGISEEVLIECIETNMTAIENPDLSLVEEKLIKLIAFLDEASYIVPYKKKRDLIISALNKEKMEISQVLNA